LELGRVIIFCVLGKQAQQFLLAVAAQLFPSLREVFGILKFFTSKFEKLVQVMFTDLLWNIQVLGVVKMGPKRFF
jgi:hypothetical protein